MPARRAALVVLSFLGFASLGLPDGVLGVAWPRIRRDFELPLDALGALLVSTTAGYVTASCLAGALLARISLGALLALSCLATGLTLFGYAAAPLWAALVALGVTAGLGAGAIDAGINAFAATHFAPRTLHWLHAAYGLGTTTGPMLMTVMLTGGFAWQSGYVVIGGVQVALALGFALTVGVWPRPTGPPARATATAAALHETLRLPAAQLGALAFFLYLGVEATAGAWLYSLLEEGRGAPMVAAGSAVSLYWGGLMVGRIAFGVAPRAWRPEVLLPRCIAAVAVAAGVLAIDLGTTASLAAGAGLGVSAAPIFPALIGATPARVGPAHTANAVGVQVGAAALGQSGLPALAGMLAARGGLEVVPLALLALSLALLAVNARLGRTPTLPAGAPSARGGCPPSPGAGR
jgi:fucose permease